MTTVELPNFGVSGGGRAATIRGLWSLVTGGTVETRPRGGTRTFAAALTSTLRPGRHNRARTMPIVSGALIIGNPIHLTVGEVAVAVDKTRSVRLTIAEVTALGNRRIAVELIASALGEDAGPDEIAHLEGFIEPGRNGTLRIVLSGPAPAGLGEPDSRMRLSATYRR